MAAPETKPRRAGKTDATKVASAYFDALNAHDLEAAVACWAVGGEENVHGQRLVIARDGVRQFLGELMEAFPDLRFDPVETIADGERCVVRSMLRGTFAGPGTWAGIQPTGARIELAVVDCLVVGDGLIVENNAYSDAMTVARQLGLMPAQDSAAQQRMTALFNARTRATAKLSGHELGQIAEGVWRLQGNPGRCNVYFVADGEGVLMFDAGARTMTRSVAAAAARLGGLTRIVLGHGHTDHRGSAPAFDVPVLCHPEEVVDAEGSGGFRYWDRDLAFLSFPHRQAHLLLHRRVWDGGPVSITGTLDAGDEIAGFEVVHLPGHAPGLIALWRERDRLALTTDCFYTLDGWARDSEPHVPIGGYNFNTEQARASIRTLAAMGPAACWPGHADAVAGSAVRERLERAADTFA